MLKVFHELKPKDVANSLGINTEIFLKHLGEKKWPSLKYEIIQQEDKEQLILSILKKLEDDNLRIVGEDDKKIWEKGWDEIGNAIKKSFNFNIDLLKPQYFEKHKILRFNGDYVRANDVEFIYECDQMIRRVVFSHYLPHYKRIIELGCGTGNSQVLLGELFQHKEIELVGADWALSSQHLLTLLKERIKVKCVPVNFNMLTLEGHQYLNIDSETAIFTVHALEQLGKNFNPLLNYLLESSPALCVHIEPIKEFYESDNLFDYLALRYHEKRNYLGNWLTELKKLEAMGKLEVLHQKRIGLGDRFHEAYGLIVWRPFKKN